MFPSRCRSDLGARAQFALGNMLFDQGSQGLTCSSKVSWLNRDRNREYFQRPGKISFYCFPVRSFDEALFIFELGPSQPWSQLEKGLEKKIRSFFCRIFRVKQNF